jgi:hypothetical protein
MAHLRNRYVLDWALIPPNDPFGRNQKPPLRSLNTADNRQFPDIHGRCMSQEFLLRWGEVLKQARVLSVAASTAEDRSKDALHFLCISHKGQGTMP